MSGGESIVMAATTRGTEEAGEKGKAGHDLCAPSTSPCPVCGATSTSDTVTTTTSPAASTSPEQRSSEAGASSSSEGLDNDIGVDKNGTGVDMEALGIAAVNGRGSGTGSKGLSLAGGACDHDATATQTASKTYRRQQASAAVGATLVTSSVRKDGKVRTESDAENLGRVALFCFYFCSVLQP